MDMRLSFDDVYDNSSDDSDFSDYSQNDRIKKRKVSKKDRRKLENVPIVDKSQNVLLKLMNQERTGYFSKSSKYKVRQQAFHQVPSRLSFCLKEIVPYCYLQGHVFMGLTVCGQFLLSYKMTCNEESTNEYSFTTAYKYELYFWIYRPHNLLDKFFKVCLFDDHGVDNLKIVTMTQWLTNSRTLIVHGASDFENEDSYISIIAVPKLGCLDCKVFRDEYSDDNFRCDALCIKCNLTIHTKYSRTESDPKFNPKLNLCCPERIIMIANGFIHMLHVELEISKYIKNYTSAANDTTSAINSVMDNNCSDEKRIQLNNSHHHEKNKLINSFICDASKGCDNSYRSSTTIVDRIIADFAENETESCNLEKSVLLSKIDKSILGNSKNFDELIITCGSQPSVNLNQASSSSSVRLLSHQNHRIINKNLMRTSGNCITTIDLNSTSSLPITETTTVPNKKLDIAAKAYEFSEDNEKCEKISIFRKRRLADKKYEFSEDNSENIIPFNRIRTFPLLTKFHKTSTTSSTNLFSTAVPNYEVTSHLHRASPNHGFRSPCGSPVGNRCMKSPPGSARSYFYHPRSPTYAMRSPNTLSPRQLKRTTNLEYETGLSSPRNDDLNFLHSPQMTTGSKNDKPICSKKFIRRFVEEDDATSVITSEEDDCISPGYHTSLPMEVHGSCYSDMQMISLSSYTKLKCPAVVITQHSFDLETFTFHVANHLCLMNNKKYGIFYDWACELVHVCPLSFILTFILMVHFTAIDTLPTGTKECLNCVNNLDCVFHRKQYQCRTLFTWNLESGDWTVLDYGDLLEVAQKSNVKNSGELNQVLQKIAADLFNNLNDLESFNNLRVLDCCNDKSKEFLRDYQNSIEFYRSVGKTSDSEFSDDSN